jgi:hypothetical protein
MFPNARNSLKRSSAAGGGAESSSNSSIPLPVAVALHNLLVPLLLPDRTRATIKKKQTSHSTIIDDDENSTSDDESHTVEEEEDKSQSHRGATWGVEHSTCLLQTIQLDIAITIEEQDDNDKKETIVYTAPLQQGGTFIVWEHLEEKLEQQLGPEWWKQKNVSYRSMKLKFTNCPTTTTDENDNEEDFPWSLEVPAHPAKLTKMSSSSEDSSLDAGVPESLPPNAVLVYFSDDSVRVDPSLHKLLVQANLVPPPPKEDVVEDFDRFDDNVFTALDQSTPQQKEQRPRTDSIGQAISTDSSSSMLRQDIPPPTLVDFPSSQLDMETYDLRVEQCQLEAMIAQEEALLEEEQKQIDGDKNTLRQVLQEAKTISNEIGLLKLEMTSQAEQLRKDAFWKEAHGIKLVRELSSIYPITKDKDGKNHFICGIKLPADIPASIINMPEEELSAALGYVCHLLVIMSKYLDIPLRHRIYANSSRSAIAQDGGSAIFPLFSARMIEREELEYGLGLLDADVECLIKSRGIEYEPTKNLLARLKIILDQAQNGSYVEIR